MTLSRRTSWFLTAFGVWSMIIWVTFDEKVKARRESVGKLTITVLEPDQA